MKLFLALLSVVFLGACSVPKDVVYFQGVDDLTIEQTEIMNQSYSSNIVTD